jgi:N-acetyl-anhydromuramyl-L-alanine amidase AmpD
MRLMFDFLFGIINGLRGSDGERGSAGRSYTNANAVKVRSPRRGESGAAAQWIGRMCVLGLGVGCGALALIAAGNMPSPKKSIQAAEQPHAAAPFLLSDETLATDPQAAPREWRYIVIHHSATNRGSAQSFDQYHRFQRGWTNGLAYHFVIGNGTDQGDGVIIAGPRWHGQEAGAHANATEYNEHGIGICLVGNLDEHPPSPAQMSALRSLIARLAAKYDIPAGAIVGHNQIRRGGSTACPGKFLNLNELRDGL